MKVLVAYESKHGSTRDIAERIAAKLREPGPRVEAHSIEERPVLAGYDAFVIGSAVYFGAWMKEAADFVRANSSMLAVKPTWLFSSGPIGEQPAIDPKEIAELADLLKTQGHRLFYGALDHERLSFSEKVVVGALKAPDGDYRDWNDIDGWAETIAAALAPAALAPA